MLEDVCIFVWDTCLVSLMPSFEVHRGFKYWWGMVWKEGFHIHYTVEGAVISYKRLVVHFIEKNTIGYAFYRIIFFTKLFVNAAGYHWPGINKQGIGATSGELNLAKEVLTDPIRRAAYDWEVRIGLRLVLFKFKASIKPWRKYQTQA